MVRHSSGIEVLAAPDVFAPMTALSSEQVADLIETLRTRYDYVIVDLPQAVMDWFAPLLDMASRAVIVTDTSVPSIKRAKRLIEVLTEDHMTLPVTVVVNAEKRPLIQSAALKEAARLLDRALTHWIPFDAAAMRRARDMGVPVILGAKHQARAVRLPRWPMRCTSPRRKGRRDVQSFHANAALAPAADVSSCAASCKRRPSIATAAIAPCCCDQRGRKICRLRDERGTDAPAQSGLNPENGRIG